MFFRSAIAGAMLAVALVPAGPAMAQFGDKWEPQPPAAPPAPPLPPCMPPALLRGADIVVLGTYGNGPSPAAPYMLHPQFKWTSSVYVAGRPRRPVVLVLAAYSPTVWDLSGVPAKRIRAVYAQGMHNQAVAGLPRNVPVVFRRDYRRYGEAPPSENCPSLEWPHDREDALRVAQLIRERFGKWPRDFYASYMPFSFNVAGGPLPKLRQAPPIARVRSAEPVMAIPDDDHFRFQREQLRAHWGRPRKAIPELQGRRLLHIRWDRRGRIVREEAETFGGDEWRKQLSTG
jgi:hypothetical protein